jgi:hypothetical protein
MHKFLQNIMLESNKAAIEKAMSRLTGWVCCILLALFFTTGMSLAQDYTLNGNVVNNGTIRVNRDIINNTTALVAITGTGVVQLKGNVGAVTAHALRSSTATYPISFTNLDMIQNRLTTCQVDITVSNNLRIGNGATAYTAAGGGFSIGTRTLTLSNLSSYMATSTSALTFSGGTVVFNSTASQLVLNNAAGVSYGTLTLSGAGAKSATTGGTITAATLTQTGGQLSVTENVDVTGAGSFADVGAISTTKKLRLAAAATSGSVTLMNNSSTGTFENASNISATIATLVGNTGTINQSGATGTISFTNAAVSAGTIANTSTGTITFVNNLTGTGAVSQTTNGTMNVGGTFVQNTYTLTGGTVVYNGTAAQSVIGGITYNNLTIATTGGNAAVSAAITLTGSLVINSGSTLDMAGFTTSAFPGALNNNAGTIRWSGNNVYVKGAGTTEFYSAAIGSVAAGINYGNLLFSGTGVKTIANAVTATGNMTINPGSSVTVGGIIVQINGSVNNSGALTNNGTINIGT